jgi:hypothetical protein
MMFQFTLPRQARDTHRENSKKDPLSSGKRGDRGGGRKGEGGGAGAAAATQAVRASRIYVCVLWV